MCYSCGRSEGQHEQLPAQKRDFGGVFASKPRFFLSFFHVFAVF